MATPDINAATAYWPGDDAGFLPLDWPDALNPSAPFNPVEINRALWQYGLPALWESAIRCPCQIGADNSNPRPNCPVCKNHPGWEFFNPQIVRLAAVGFSLSWSPFERFGPWAPGQCDFTVRGEHCPGFMDRVTLKDARMPVSYLLTRQAVRYEGAATLPYPIVPFTLEGVGESSIVQSVTRLRPVGSDNLPMAAMVLGTDFDVTPTGGIDWAKGDALGTAPAVGASFSIAYMTRPVYRVMSMQHASRIALLNIDQSDIGAIPLPVQFTAKLEPLAVGVSP